MTRFFNNTHHRIYVNTYRTAVESEEMIMIIDFIFFSFFSSSVVLKPILGLGCLIVGF
jgi:hypothetical protein